MADPVRSDGVRALSGFRVAGKTAASTLQSVAKLAPHFAGLVAVGVQIEIDRTPRQGLGLFVPQRGGAFDRTLQVPSQWNDRIAILAGFGRTVEMGCGHLARQAGILDRPG